MSEIHKLYLLTGSNIEPRLQYLRDANSLIELHIGEILQASAVYESAPWGFEATENFLNQVVLVNTGFSPEQVLKRLLLIEKQMGRIRNDKGYSSRTIDIDILYYDLKVIEQPNLIIPHPRLHLRKFTLLPLTELAGEMIHPILGLSHIDLLARIKEHDEVTKFEEPNQ